MFQPGYGMAAFFSRGEYLMKLDELGKYMLSADFQRRVRELRKFA